MLSRLSGGGRAADFYDFNLFARGNFRLSKIRLVRR